MTSFFFFRASGGNQPTGIRSGILIPEPPCKVRVDHPEIWHRLATRVDLAKNVRSVRIMKQIASSRGRSRSTLTNFNEEAKANLEVSSPEMLTALSNVKSLQRFTWIGNSAFPGLPDSFFKVLVGCQELQEVKLWQVSPRLDQLTTESSVL